MTCMPTKEFKDAFPLSWQRFIDACQGNGIQVKNIEEVDVYFRRNGEIYKVLLRTEKRSICL